LLSYKELAAFSAKGVEFTSETKTYCGDPTCSTFLPPWLIDEERATCPKCWKTTHVPCQTVVDGPDHECPPDQATQQVLDLADSEGWRRCPQCQTLVELMHGCNHITCRCGQEFCYVCGAGWRPRACTCALWHEDRLYDIANRVADDAVAAGAHVHQRAGVLARVVDELIHHEDVGCEHDRPGQWRYQRVPDRRCENCRQTLPNYIFECRNCRMLSCRRCMRHRLR